MDNAFTPPQFHFEPSLTESLPARQSDACGFSTQAIRAGQQRGNEGEHSDPIYTTSSFVFSSAAEAMNRFVDDVDGNIYSRFTNPTVRSFEHRLAALEGGRFATATGSGMAAILLTGLATLRAGDHVVASAGLFGSTVTLFKTVFARLGINTSFVNLSDIEQWRLAIRPNTRILFVETPSNPLCELADISALSDLAKEHGARLVVDNCFCTPALQQPLQLGADLVVHSATKYLDGQGRCVGGAVVYNDESLHDQLSALMRCAGPSLSPFNAWVFLKGLETLQLRMRAHCDNAQQISQWLDRHPAVTRVLYPGLESHPQHALARAQQSGFGGVVSFEVAGGREGAWRVIDSTRMLSITANLGDTKTTITHPATTTHGRLSSEDRDAAGIRENLVRLSVGLEDADDIIADLAKGLDQALALTIGEVSPVPFSHVTGDNQAAVLIEAAELELLLGDCHFQPQDIQIVDLSSPELYSQEHIPGAINFDYGALITGEEPAAGKLPQLEEIKEQLELSGISSEGRMVVYDSEGNGKAARFCWTMDVLGFEDWSLLNGGIDAWDNDQRALTSEIIARSPASFDIKDCRRTRHASFDDMSKLVNSDEVGLLDARSSAEFVGTDVRARRGGRIPGSRNFDWLAIIDPLDCGRIRDARILQRILNELDLGPNKEIVVYCQTHHRSSLSYVMLKWLGYQNIRGYAGSWSEWGNRCDTPVATG